jgi:hypothetical protein
MDSFKTHLVANLLDKNKNSKTMEITKHLNGNKMEIKIKIAKHPHDTSLLSQRDLAYPCHTPQCCSHPWNYGDCSTET